jgi:peptide/nickel transport system substrate-binding protein
LLDQHRPRNRLESENTFTNYCDLEVEKLLDAQLRKKLVCSIERKLAQNVAYPILSHNSANTCWHPYVKGHVQHENNS